MSAAVTMNIMNLDTGRLQVLSFFFLQLHCFTKWKYNLHLHGSSYPGGCHDNFDLLTEVGQSNVCQRSARLLFVFSF